jgi:lipoprotein signal peptidase
MLRVTIVLAGTAGVLAAVDLLHKAATDTVMVHERSALYVAGVTVASLIWMGAIVLTRSTSIAFGGGVLAGGAVGNLLSLAFWPGVPNPIVTGTIEFNLADLFLLAGFVLVGVATVRFGLQNRDRLREPVRLR